MLYKVDKSEGSADETSDTAEFSIAYHFIFVTLKEVERHGFESKSDFASNEFCILL